MGEGQTDPLARTAASKFLEIRRQFSPSGSFEETIWRASFAAALESGAE